MSYVYFHFYETRCVHVFFAGRTILNTLSSISNFFTLKNISFPACTVFMVSIFNGFAIIYLSMLTWMDIKLIPVRIYYKKIIE